MEDVKHALPLFGRRQIQFWGDATFYHGAYYNSNAAFFWKAPFSIARFSHIILTCNIKS